MADISAIKTPDGTGYNIKDATARTHATTSVYGITELSTSTSSTSTSKAATPSAVKAAYDLANGKQDAISDISKSGSTYSGGLADEKLLTTATINKWKTILGIS